MKTIRATLVCQDYKFCPPEQVKDERQRREGEKRQRISKNLGRVVSVLSGAALGIFLAADEDAKITVKDLGFGVIFSAFIAAGSEYLTNRILQSHETSETTSFAQDCEWLKHDDKKHGRKPYVQANQYHDCSESWKPVESGIYTYQGNNPKLFK